MQSTNVLPEYEVKLEVRVDVPANSVVEAKEAAETYLQNHVGVVRAVAESAVMHWRPVAERLLEEGMSHSEISRELGIDRSYISRLYPGTGLTREEGLEIGRLQKKVNQQLQK